MAASVVIESPAERQWLRASLDFSAFTAERRTATVTVQPSVNEMPEGIYRAMVLVHTSAGFVQQIPVTLVVGSDSCRPSVLLLVFTAPQQEFVLKAGEAAAVEVAVVDECGKAVTGGAVTFTPLGQGHAVELTHAGSGHWSGSWVATGDEGAAITAVVTAADSSPGIRGDAVMSGVVAGLIAAPALYSIEIESGRATAGPGERLILAGSGLADASGPTEVTLGGWRVDLESVSATRIVALAPTDAPDSCQPLVIRRTGLSTVPEYLLVRASLSP